MTANKLSSITPIALGILIGLAWMAYPLVQFGPIQTVWSLNHQQTAHGEAIVEAETPY